MGWFSFPSFAIGAVWALVCALTGFELALRSGNRKRRRNPLCPYPDIHADDCDCEGMGGPR